MQSLEPALFLCQAGYLTVKKTGKALDYCLTYPNLEVRTAMLKLVKHNFFDSEAEQTAQVERFCSNLLKSNFADVFTTFCHIISRNPRKDFEDIEAKSDFALECFYRDPIFIFLRTAGYKVDIECHGNLGQPCIVLDFTPKTFLFDFKVSKSGASYDIKKKIKESLGQTFDTNYPGPYKNPALVSLIVNGKLRRIEYAAVAGDVYEFVQQEFDGPPATFQRISDLGAFLEQFEVESGQVN
ncbi:MAG: hypothetical protein LBR22_10930 [Desulfovibrio sp.]|jgi:hypothetical protein|nr:hypothetical protein [Desulfovibrio sp.]